MKTISFILVILVILAFSGCSSKNLNTLVKQNNLIGSGKAIAYAHMSSNGTKLVKVTLDKPRNIDKNIELIKITKNGFLPNYKIPTTLEKSCETNVKNQPFCNSHYTNGQFGVGDAIVTSLGTALFLGTNLLTGHVVYTAKFDDKKFIQIIKNNNLQAYQNKIKEFNPLQRRGIKVITPEMLLMSTNDIFELQVPQKTRKSFYLKAIRSNLHLIKFIKNPDKDMQIEYINQVSDYNYLNDLNNIYKDIPNLAPVAKNFIELRKKDILKQRKLKRRHMEAENQSIESSNSSNSSNNYNKYEGAWSPSSGCTPRQYYMRMCY